MLKWFILFQLFFLSRQVVIAQLVDITHLKLTLRFDWDKRQCLGKAAITFTPLKETNKLYLDAARMAIGRVYLRSQSLSYTYNDSLNSKQLEIVLDRKYKPGDTLTVQVNYSTNHVNESDPGNIAGSFGVGLRFHSPTKVTPKKRRQLWSSGEPTGNRYWFPSNEDIADIHTTEVIATLEKPLLLISNGRLINTIDHGDNTRTFHYKSDKPFPNFLVSIAIGEYINIEQRSGKTTINNFGYPDEKEAIAATVELLPDMLRFLEEKTGYPYPFSTYSQVVVQDYPFPGLVGQHSMSLLSDNYIDDYGVHKDFKYLWDGVAMQALANQWFGNLLMPKSWEDSWLNKAFAQYFAGLYTAKNNTKQEYLTYYHPFEQSSVVSDRASGNIHPVVTKKINNLTEFTRDSYATFKGALILRMLQHETGETNWWRVIEDYVRSHAYKQVSTKDFQHSLEKICGKSYQWFFDQWIYKAGLPGFEVTQAYDAAQKRLLLSVKQIHKQDSSNGDTSDQYYQGKITIETDAGLETAYIRAQPENSFAFNLNKAPLFVNFNYEETFFCESRFQKSKESYFNQLTLSRDVLAKQTALDSLARIITDSNSISLTNQLTDALITEIRSDHYWRYRWYALSVLRQITKSPYTDKITNFLIELIKKEQSWIKSTAISMLGNTKDLRHEAIYLAALYDKSDRVINAAAIALGKTKSSRAFDALMDLESRPSWKNQNRISALNGFQQLEDKRAAAYALQCLTDNYSPRWYLATPVWDYPFAAAQTLKALGETEQAYRVLEKRMQEALENNDLNDIFQQAQLLEVIGDSRGLHIYDLLKIKFNHSPSAISAISALEKSLKNKMSN